MAEMMTHIPAGTVAMGNVDPAGEFRNGTPIPSGPPPWR